MPKQKKSSSSRYRSARTGQYVSKKYATGHPKTTVKETDRRKK